MATYNKADVDQGDCSTDSVVSNYQTAHYTSFFSFFADFSKKLCMLNIHTKHGSRDLSRGILFWEGEVIGAY